MKFRITRERFKLLRNSPREVLLFLVARQPQTIGARCYCRLSESRMSDDPDNIDAQMSVTASVEAATR